MQLRAKKLIIKRALVRMSSFLTYTCNHSWRAGPVGAPPLKRRRKRPPSCALILLNTSLSKIGVGTPVKDIKYVLRMYNGLLTSFNSHFAHEISELENATSDNWARSNLLFDGLLDTNKNSGHCSHQSRLQFRQISVAVTNGRVGQSTRGLERVNIKTDISTWRC